MTGTVHRFPFRPLPETASLRVTEALTGAALSALNSRPPLPPAERAAQAMERTAALFDALARDTEDMIARCRTLTITHEALIERLTFRLNIEKASARMLRDPSAAGEEQ